MVILCIIHLSLSCLSIILLLNRSLAYGIVTLYEPHGLKIVAWLILCTSGTDWKKWNASGSRTLLANRESSTYRDDLSVAVSGNGFTAIELETAKSHCTWCWYDMHIAKYASWQMYCVLKRYLNVDKCECVLDWILDINETILWTVIYQTTSLVAKTKKY